jgi:hypothetical protein
VSGGTDGAACLPASSAAAHSESTASAEGHSESISSVAGSAATLEGEGATSADAGGVDAGGVDTGGAADSALASDVGGFEGRRGAGAGVEVADDAGNDGGREALAGSGPERDGPVSPDDAAGTDDPGRDDASFGDIEGVAVPSEGRDALGTDGRAMAAGAVETCTAGGRTDAISARGESLAVVTVPGSFRATLAELAAARCDGDGAGVARTDARSVVFGTTELVDGETPGAFDGVAFFSGPGAAVSSEGDPSLGERAG